MKRIPPGILPILLVAGCASYSGAGLQAGVDREDRVRSVMGNPSLELRNPDGTSAWAYSHGPQGYETYMARFTSSGVLAGVENVLDTRHFARVAPGLDKEEVLRIVGPPASTEAFPIRDELVWDYRFVDPWGYSSYFSVVLDARGRVKETLTWRERYDHKP